MNLLRFKAAIISFTLIRLEFDFRAYLEGVSLIIENLFGVIAYFLRIDH